MIVLLHLIAVRVTIKIGTMARKIMVVLNTLLFPMITDFQLTDNQLHSNRCMLSEPKLNDTIHVFNSSDAKEFFVRNGISAKNLNTIAHISLLTIAITSVITKKNISYRRTKSIKRLA